MAEQKGTKTTTRDDDSREKKIFECLDKETMKEPGSTVQENVQVQHHVHNHYGLQGNELMIVPLSHLYSTLATWTSLGLFLGLYLGHNGFSKYFSLKFYWELLARYLWKGSDFLETFVQ